MNIWYMQETVAQHYPWVRFTKPFRRNLFYTSIENVFLSCLVKHSPESLSITSSLHIMTHQISWVSNASDIPSTSWHMPPHTDMVSSLMSAQRFGFLALLKFIPSTRATTPPSLQLATLNFNQFSPGVKVSPMSTEEPVLGRSFADRLKWDLKSTHPKQIFLIQLALHI